MSVQPPPQALEYLDLRLRLVRVGLLVLDNLGGVADVGGGVAVVHVNRFMGFMGERDRGRG